MKTKIIKKNNDLNYLIIKDRKGKSIIRKIVYSRVVLTFFLILIQIFIISLFILRLQKYIEYYFGASIAVTTAFMFYLSNCKTKNEFKIAWIVPLVIFPLFGASAYLIYHTDWNQYRIGKKLLNLYSQLKFFNPSEKEAKKVLKNFPEVEGLGNYLLNRGGYFPSNTSRLTYYKNGEEFYPVLIEELKKAEDFIFIEFFIIDVDDSWGEIVKILEQKSKAGVTVRVLCDGFGSPMTSTKSYQKYMKQHKIDFKVFLPIIPFISTHLNNRDHRKIIVIDGKVAFTGGVNISNEYFNMGNFLRFKYWKDNVIKLEGNAIQNLTSMFLQTWNIDSKSPDNYEHFLHCDYSAYKTSKGLIIPYGDDVFNREDIAESVYLFIIHNAKKYLYISTPYLLLDNQLMDALIFASKRGVDVKIIVPAVYDHFMTFCIGKTFLKTLVENDINILLYQKGFIHQKTFICDDKIATVGSINLDYRSLFHHFECGVFMYDTNILKEIKNDFDEILTDCKAMKKKDYKALPLRYRLVGRLFRIFSPLF